MAWLQELGSGAAKCHRGDSDVGSTLGLYETLVTP